MIVEGPPDRYTDADRRAALSDYDRANQVIETVREARRQSGKLTSGGRHIDESTHTAISSTKAHSSIIRALEEAYKLPSEAITSVCESFEEMARRNQIPIPDELRPAIYKRLVVTLQGNMLAFGEKPKNAKKFCAVSYLCGDISTLRNKNINNDPTQPTYGEYFEGNESIFKYSAVNYPSDPVAFLDGVVATIKTLPGKHINNNPTRPTYGEYFEGSESIFKYSAVNYPTDPAAFLNQTANNIEAILKHNPTLIRRNLMHSAINSPTAFAVLAERAKTAAAKTPPL